MNQQALERIIAILLAEIDHLQEALILKNETIIKLRSEIVRIDNESTDLLVELEALQRGEKPKRPVGRPKGSKSKPKVVA